MYIIIHVKKIGSYDIYRLNTQTYNLFVKKNKNFFSFI
jgi:hypothetical protein